MIEKDRKDVSVNVLIVGAGFGGLALAAYLRRDGHSVTIVDHKKNRQYKGFVMGLWRNGLHTLEPFGVVDRIHSLGYAIVEEMDRDKTGTILTIRDYRNLVKHYGPVFNILHADLYTILQELAEGVPICYETSVHALEEQPEAVSVSLSNGLRGEFDLVVGADGLHSWVRTYLFGNEGLAYTGVRMWFSMLPPGMIRLTEPNNLYGEGEYACVLPTESGKVGVEFLAAVPGEEPDLPEERISMLRSRFDDFGWIIPNILHSLHDPKEIVSYPIQDVSLKRWHRGRIVLLGDAAHAVSPTVTMGCAMALEDAHVLTEELRLVDSAHIEEALSSYVTRRKARVGEIHHVSDFVLRWTGMKEHVMVFFRNIGMRLVPRSMLLFSMEEIIDPKHDV